MFQVAKINVDKLSLAILENLEIFQNNTVETVTKAVTETAKETVDKLKADSPEGQTGDYAHSWSYRRDPDLRGKWRFSMVVYSKKPDYRLTHLLEYGHVLKDRRGRLVGVAGAKPHIRLAEQYAEKKLVQKLRTGLKK